MTFMKSFALDGYYRDTETKKLYQLIGVDKDGVFTFLTKTDNKIEYVKLNHYEVDIMEKAEQNIIGFA